MTDPQVRGNGTGPHIPDRDQGRFGVPAPTPSDPPDPELGHEQRHLAASRAALARMRARTASLDQIKAMENGTRESGIVGVE
jgi:hypothetical protein